MSHIIYNCIIILITGCCCNAWRAIPANKAMYAVRSDEAGMETGFFDGGLDGILPRNTVHSTYKFGWCTPDSIAKQFLRKQVNMTIATAQAARANYLYLLMKRHSQRFALQCIVMKIYVPFKYMFRKSRLPLYYCQGEIYYMLMNTIQRLEVHEFYLFRAIDLPATFVFEFYHPTIV